MLNTKEIHFRLTRQQLAVIKTKAEVHGYTSVSAYVRDKVVKFPNVMKRQLLEIHQTLGEESQ